MIKIAMSEIKVKTKSLILLRKQTWDQQNFEDRKSVLQNSKQSRLQTIVDKDIGQFLQTEMSLKVCSM